MKRNRVKRIKKQAAKVLDFPEDVMMDLPRVTIAGTSRVYIDNHAGLLGYTNEEITVSLPDGTVRIRGAEMEIDDFETDRLIISGKIDSVEYGG